MFSKPRFLFMMSHCC